VHLSFFLLGMAVERALAGSGDGGYRLWASFSGGGPAKFDQADELPL